MMQLSLATKDDLDKIAQYISNVNRIPHMRSAFVGKDKDEILEYMEEMYVENEGSILLLEDGTDVVGAVAGDICSDNHTIEVIGPFINFNITEQELYTQKMIEAMFRLKDGYRLQFFLDAKNILMGQLILQCNGKMTGEHCNMFLTLSDRYRPDHIGPMEAKYIRYTNDLVEQENVKSQIEKLHNDLFPTSHYNGETIMKSLDENHHISYCLEAGHVVSYGFYNTEDDGYLEFIGTNPQYRGKGYASVLLHHISEYLRTQKCTCINLCVDYENKEAIRLYEKTGFTIEELNQAYVME